MFKKGCQFIALVLACSFLLGCNTNKRNEVGVHFSTFDQQEIAKVLAPSGKLRVGLYQGSPTSYIPGLMPDQHRGLGYELGRQLAKDLDVPYEPVIYSKNADVFAGMRRGEVQILFTNATPERAKELMFSVPFLRVEQSYLVKPHSPIQKMSQIDQIGIKVGVSVGSTSEKTLSSALKNAKVISISSLENAQDQLRSGKIDAFATNKSILFELSDKLPHSRVLDGAWGYEQFSAGVSHDKRIAIDYLNRFVKQQIDSGFVGEALKRSGIRGAI